MLNLDLKGKRALVGGSTQGIGKSTAMLLASLGADVTLIARNEQKLEDICDSLSTEQKQIHHFIVADYNQPEKLEETVKHYLQIVSPIHIVVHNTGGPVGGPILQAESKEFLTAFNQHLINSHNITKLVIDGMKSAKYGRIVNVISTSVKAPITGLGVSNTIRGAVANWAKTLANETAQYGITVNNVLPGATKTQRLESIIEKKAEKTKTTIQETEKTMLASIPAKRFAEPEEVAAAIAFLTTPAAAYITGINLPVDGGRLPML